jgi:hypothetical protein
MDSSISDDPKAPDVSDLGGIATSGPIDRSAPAAEPAPEAAVASPEPSEAPAEVVVTDEEKAAQNGPWTPSNELLHAGGTAHPVWDLDGGWVGTRIGDPVTGAHVVAPDRDELTRRVAEVMALVAEREAQNKG